MCCMSKSAARVLLPILALAFAGTSGITAMGAAEARPAQRTGADNKRDKQEEEILRKYDKNRNGKLDPDEAAELKADQAKAKRKKRG